MDSSFVQHVAAVPATTLDGSQASSARQLTSKSLASPWLWTVAACVLLGISGGVRFWRDRQFHALAAESAACPFPLSEFPTRLGTWQVQGPDAELEPEIARLAGSSAHIIRAYVDEKSGETVTVLILYGLANSVFGHTPEVCYPSAGYQPVGVAADHAFPIAGSATLVRFRSAFFSRRIGGIGQYKEVFYTFLHNGQWLPEVQSRWKLFRYHPGMFKIQLEHNASGLSSETENSATESLLREIVQEIDRRTSRNQSPAAGVSTPSQLNQ